MGTRVPVVTQIQRYVMTLTTRSLTNKSHNDNIYCPRIIYALLKLSQRHIAVSKRHTLHRCVSKRQIGYRGDVLPHNGVIDSRCANVIMSLTIRPI